MTGRRLLLAGGLLLLAGCAGTIEAPPARNEPAISSAPEAETGGTGEVIVAGDGTVLPLRTWLPEHEPRAVILGLHGFNDYSASFALPAAWWAQQGVAVYAYDQRGHGATARPGIWPGLEAMVADARMATELVAARHRGVPLFLLGESMGGAIAILSRVPAEGRQRAPAIDGLVLVAPGIARRDAFPLYQRWGLELISTLAPSMRFTGENLELQPSDNIDVLVEMWYDPLILKDARADTLEGLLDLTTLAADSIGWIAPPQPGETLRPPALMIFGGNEQVVPLTTVGEVLGPQRERWDADPSWRLGYYDAGYHMLLRDLEGQTIWADILAWMSVPEEPLLSGAGEGAWEALAGAPPDGG